VLGFLCVYLLLCGLVVLWWGRFCFGGGEFLMVAFAGVGVSGEWLGCLGVGGVRFGWVFLCVRSGCGLVFC